VDFMVGELQSLRDLSGPITHPRTKFERNQSIRGAVIAL